jgi:signal transduction histidine kinase
VDGEMLFTILLVIIGSIFSWKLFLYRQTQKKKIKDLEEAVEVRDEVLSVASHELKTPLTSLHLEQQILHRSAKKAIEKEVKCIEKNGGVHSNILDQILKSTKKSEQASNRIVKLLDNLLDISKMRVGKIKLEREKVDLVELTRSLIESMSADFREAGITVSFKSNTPAVVGFWDVARIEQVLRNLLSNGIKYGRQKPVEVKIEASDSEGVVTLVVQDNGIGIPEDLHGRVFEPFVRGRVSKRIRGTGLGLYICQKIVKAHGGLIVLESRPGKGSIFRVRLPWEAELAKIPLSAQNEIS